MILPELRYVWACNKLDHWLNKVSVLTRCGRLHGKWSIGVRLSRELDDFIICVQRRWFRGGQWWWSGIFVCLPSLLFEHELSGTICQMPRFACAGSKNLLFLHWNLPHWTFKHNMRCGSAGLSKRGARLRSWWRARKSYCAEQQRDWRLGILAQVMMKN
jgi:hypothetical protein